MENVLAFGCIWHHQHLQSFWRPRVGHIGLVVRYFDTSQSPNFRTLNRGRIRIRLFLEFLNEFGVRVRHFVQYQRTPHRAMESKLSLTSGIREDNVMKYNVSILSLCHM